MSPPRETKQIHLPVTDWKTIDDKAPERGRSATVAALARALAAGDVANFDTHLAAVQAETKAGQADRMRTLRASRGVNGPATADVMDAGAGAGA